MEVTSDQCNVLSASEDEPSPAAEAKSSSATTTSHTSSPAFPQPGCERSAETTEAQTRLAGVNSKAEQSPRPVDIGEVDFGDPDAIARARAEL
jgi:hypothetical protein